MTKRLCYIGFYVLLLCSTLSGYSQEFSYINYDTKDGLAASTVYDMVQDRDGFIWFATENGLSRFDGKRFLNLTISDGLPDNEILKLFIDSKDRLWIIPFKADICYWHKGKLYTKHNDSLLRKIQLKANVFGIEEDRHGNLVFNEFSLFHVVRTDNSVQRFDSVDNHLLSGHSSGLSDDRELKIVVNTHRVPATHADFYFYPILNKIEPLDFKIAPNIRFVMMRPGLFVYQTSPTSIAFELKGKREEIEIPDNVMTMNYLSNDTISVNTEKGPIFYDLRNKQTSWPLPVNVPVTSAFRDKEGNYWFTTRGRGVFMLPSLNFKSIQINPDRPAIRSLLRIDTNLYAGCDGSLWIASLRDLKFRRYYIGGKAFENESIKFTTLTNYKGKLITATSNGFPAHPHLNMSQMNVSFKYASLKDDKISFASHVMSFAYNLKNHTIDTIWKNRTTSVLEGDSGYYIGTLNGLFYKSFKNDTISFGTQHDFLNNRISFIAHGPGSIVFVGIKGGGLAALKHNRLLYQLTDKKGLSNNSPTSIYADSNIVWLGTEKGLNRIECSGDSTFEITSFSVSDGLPSDMIDCIQIVGDTVFVGTPKGLSFFVPEKISHSSTCDLNFTGIYVSGNYWAYDSTGFSLPHHNNNLRFDFSGISFKSAGEVTYQYRLLGLHSDWRATTSNTLSFPTLPSGSYTLQVKAINKYGEESRVKEISFTIRELLWEKNWFRLLLLAVIGILIWIFIRYRVSQIRRKESEKENLDRRIMELEQSALRSQMNPHFIFNSLNSIQHYVVERDLSGANRFITDFSYLIRMTLDFSTKSTVKLSDEMQYIDTYLRLEKVRLEDKFDYTIIIEDGIDLDEYSIPSLILQPFVENSIRHGIKYREDNNGMIKLVISRQDTALSITIEDNGVGRAMANQYKSEHHVQYQSRGMLLSTGRIDMLNAHGDEKIDFKIIDLYDQNRKAAGTRVELILHPQT